MYRPFLLLPLLLGFFSSASIFSSPEADSLRSLIERAPNDSSKVWLYHELSKVFYTTDQDSTLFYLQPALALSREIGFHKGEAATVLQINVSHIVSGNTDELTRMLSEVVPPLLQHKDLGPFRGKLLSQIGNQFLSNMAHDSAQYYFQLAEIANIASGNAYNNWGVYSDMARVYQTIGEDEMRNLYHKKAYQLTKEKQIRMDHGFVLYYLLLYAYKDGRFADYATYMEEYRQFTQREDGTNNSLIHPFYFADKEETNEEKLEKALSILKEQIRMKHTQSVMNTYSDLANLKHEMGDYEGALSYALKGIKIVRDIRQPYFETGFLAQVSENYEQLGNYKESLRYHKMSVQLNDSLHVKEAQKNFQEMRVKYETEKQEKELAASQFALEKASINNRALTLTASLIGVLAVIALYFLYFKSKTNRLLEQKNTTIAHSLEEKETLLREIHHRVKNNLQVVSSLLSLQSDSITDAEARQAFQEGQDRVYSMTLIHQNLYQTDNLTSMDIKDYIEKLADSLFHSYNIRQEHIQLSIEAEPLLIDVDTLIPIGLILNELLSNALKHAFPSGEEGQIDVIFKQEQEALLLAVKDDGVGIPESKLTDHSNSFGMTLIKSFAKKLGAELTTDTQVGTTLSLRIHNYQLAS
ncbi:MAG: sensor histidine kinase [Bacteroidota bacterium]